MKRKLLLTISLIVCLMNQLSAQNPMSIGTLSDQNLIINSGTNFLLIPNIDDGEAGSDQTITFTATSDDNDIVEVTSVDFTAGNTFAVINVEVKDLLDTATISVTADDGDGTLNEDFDVAIITYSKPGLHLGIFDMAFWEQNDPYGKVPTYDTVISSADFVPSSINWDNVSLSISAGCSGGYCDGHDFATIMMSGYIIPPITGNYRFFQTAQNENALYLSTDDNYDNKQTILHTSQAIGSNTSGDEWQSTSQFLIAGKVYAIYNAHWYVHKEDLSIAWETAGLTKQIIDINSTMHTYDPEFPTLTSDIEIYKTGVNDIMVNWYEATDNQILDGYNVYVDGIKVNTEIIKDTVYTVEGLSAETTYSIAYVAVDLMGNESLLSNIITETTYAADATPPPAPTNIVMPEATGLAVKITWDDVIDGETAIWGYDLYVDGTKYNDEYIYNSEAIIKGLSPVTDYDITIVAVDAGFNESVASATFVATTTKYSVGSNMGVINGQISIDMEPISWNHGIGIDGPDYHKTGSAPDAYYHSLMEEFKPGSVRLMWDWSTSGHCDDYTAPGLLTEPSLSYTIGDFMNMGNMYDAYSMLTISLQEDAVFVNNQNNLLNILEYYCGDAATTYGALRAADGYTEPLIDNCPGLVIEFGNEVWGGSSHCIPLGDNYNNYAAWCKTADELIKGSEYYDPDKIITCYNGRDPSPSSLNNDLYQGAPDVDWIALSGYMGGNFDYFEGIDPGNSELEYLQNGVGFMIQYLQYLNNSKKDMLKYTGEIKPMWFYEGNMTTNYYYGRFGQALIYTDYMAGAISEGTFTNLFSLFGNQFKIVNPATSQKLPLFIIPAFFNNHCKGHVLKTTFETTSTIEDASGNVLAGHPVGAYAYLDTTQLTIMLSNRNFVEDAYVQIDIPDTLTYSSSAKKYTFSSDHYSSYETIIDTTDITVDDSIMVYIPAGTIVFINIEGLTQDLEELEFCEFTQYKKADDISIQCALDCSVTTDAGFVSLTAAVTPVDVFVDAAKWEVIDNTIGANIGSYGDNGLIIQGSGTCTGNGTVTVRAYSVTDYTVYDDITVTITGQTESTCSTFLDENHDVVLKVYPNPATQFVNLDIFKDLNSGTLSMMNISGQVLQYQILETGRSTYEFNVESLPQGIYFMRVNSDNYSKTIKFIVE